MNSELGVAATLARSLSRALSPVPLRGIHRPGGGTGAGGATGAVHRRSVGVGGGRGVISGG